ncbi:D-hexose-6-phosphate mutarotase [Granulicella arctica]|uniref:Putative glucose-6-phosphate 1-epimerase n=1 Tax=Granulicella arctica TaxID=940613 RepID=A0A7Y9TGH3_9BACT|nr:D-hexose-6-phosphate mutarotase [Granulicella arctica]NYF78760.1 glucose-6-phosphate 1-epimerase [Granulicella arctica]
MNLTQLNEDFGLPGMLRFEQTPTGLIYAEVSTPAAAATVYLQGAHLTHWQPTGQQPVLFLSRKSDLEPGKPIRGGVPIAFPWFAVDQKADRINGKPGPSHGFARTENWTLAFAALSGDDLHLTFTLAPNATSRSMGFDHFRVAFQLTIGRTLTMQLTVANDAPVAPLVFEEALHTYFAVADVHEVSVTGLEPTAYIDKTDNFKLKPALHAPLTFTGFTDRIYNHTKATCVLHDVLGKRRIVVEKTNSDTTVVFNPWKELPDLGPDEWHELLCVETVNAAESPVTVGPGKAHTMQAHISVEVV